MALYVDTANLDDARWSLKLPCISGFTCNPALMAQALGRSSIDQKAYMAHLSTLMDLVPPGGRVFIQVTRPTAEGMQAEATRLIEGLVGTPARSLAIKIPFTEAGLVATAALVASKIPVAITGVYTPEQACMSALCGAEYVIPYISRLERPEGDRIQTVRTMLGVFLAQGLSCRVLAASVKTNQDFAALLALQNCDVTAPPALLRASFDHPGTVDAVKRFSEALTIS